jgi:tRNA pseudouridine38-40 synthase
MKKHRYKLKLAYDGSRFKGWQVQPGAPTVQQTLQEVISTIVREPVGCTGAGRTDAGVHALGQVAHMNLSEPFDPARLLRSTNCLLPPDIRCLSIEPAEPTFHARKSARSKTYRYHIQGGPYHHPLRRSTSLYCRHPLDLDAMRTAASLYVGTHDFTSFANSPREGAVSRGAVRTLLRCDIQEEPGGYYLDVEGTGFLYKMVRNLVGTLLEIGKGRRPVNDVVQLLQDKDRVKAGAAAPAHGLFLFSVSY